MGSYSQQERIFRLKTPLENTELLIEGFSGTEELSSLYEFKLRLLCEAKDVDAKKLLRKPVTIFLKLDDGTERHFHGIINSFRQEGEFQQDLILYHATVVPKIWLLTLNADCRIFQDKTVVEIVKALLDEAGIKDYRVATTGTYDKREYCVQYRESTFNFISRLLEEEGIFYFFEHEEKKHTIVFADQSSARSEVTKHKGGVVMTSASGFTRNKRDGIQSVERIEQVHVTKVALTDYDFEKPKMNLLVSQQAKQPDSEELFDYPGGYTVIKSGDKLARVRLEERESQQLVLEGSSRCRGFEPGYFFELKEHFRKETNGKWFLVSVDHQVTDTTYRGGTDTPHDYKNVFRVIPKTTPFRPAQRAMKPTVKGPQTALVVGKTGEEIWVDKYGRVKVQFFWDRKGKKNELSSCWVRVSQAWAGKNWGWVTLPRMGQEVIVDFLEGDPDRPIITGRVYNSDQMPPYTLNTNQTQSGIKSRSSKAGGTEDFNEIRFEDKKGSEMFTMHAQKDMETTVENDDTQTIQRNRTIKVDGTHTETIKGNTTITITEGNHVRSVDKGNKTTTIKMGNETTTLNMGNQTHQLKMGNHSLKMDLGKSTTEAMQSIELKVGASSIKVDQTGVTIKGMMIKIEGTIMVQMKGSAMVQIQGGITLIN